MKSVGGVVGGCLSHPEEGGGFMMAEALHLHHLLLWNCVSEQLRIMLHNFWAAKSSGFEK